MTTVYIVFRTDLREEGGDIQAVFENRQEADTFAASLPRYTFTEIWVEEWPVKASS